MSKCSCPNALCRCLYGCGCQNDSNNKKTERCLCCRFLSETKQKKTNTIIQTQCKCDNSNNDQDYHYDDHYDDIILCSNKYYSLRYQCYVTIDDGVQLNFNTRAPSKLLEWPTNIKIKYDLNNLFNGAVSKDYKIICFVNEEYLYSNGYIIPEINFKKN